MQNIPNYIVINIPYLKTFLFILLYNVFRFLFIKKLPAMESFPQQEVLSEIKDGTSVPRSGVPVPALQAYCLHLPSDALPQPALQQLPRWSAYHPPTCA